MPLSDLPLRVAAVEGAYHVLRAAVGYKKWLSAPQRRTLVQAFANGIALDTQLMGRPLRSAAPPSGARLVQFNPDRSDVAEEVFAISLHGMAICAAELPEELAPLLPQILPMLQQVSALRWLPG